MKVLPTLYIQHGRAVPPQDESSSGTAPLELAANLADLSARFAIIDVDAARGCGNNRETIASVVRHLRKTRNKVCIQVGGGIRGSDQAQYYLDLGVTWLIVGTLLYRSPVAVEQLLARFSEHMTAAIDARGGEILSSGGARVQGLSLEGLARRVHGFGFQRILFTDIPESPQAEPDFASAKFLANTAKLPLFMAGSLRTMEQVNRAASLHCLHGVMIDAHLAAEQRDLFLAPAGQDA